MENNPYIATVWSFLERLSTQIVGFIIGVFLARILSPHDYGVVGLTSIFITFSNVFIDSGFSNALIKKVNRTQEDLSTAFFFNCATGLILYLLLLLLAPVIAIFFDEPILTSIIRIVGLNILLNSLCIVQNAILTAKLNIRLQTICNLSAQLPAGIIAIYLATTGFGVYALALQIVISALIKTILLWLFAKWKPSFVFDYISFKYLWSFGSKILCASLIGATFNEVYSVIIGKFIGRSELGYYSKASHLNNNISSVNNGIVQKIALPVLSKYQNNINVLSYKFRSIMKLLVMFISPISAFFCFSASEIIITLWTEKWLESIPVFRYLVIGTMWIPIGSLSLSLLQVVGRTSTILKLEFPKKMCFAIIIFIGFKYGIMGLAIGQLLINILAAIINMVPTKRVLNYSYRLQLWDLLKYMILAYGVSSIVSIFVSSWIINPLVSAIVKFIIPSLLYCLVLFISKDQTFIDYIYKKISKKCSF